MKRKTILIFKNNPELAVAIQKEKVEICIITEPIMEKKLKPISAAQAEALQKALE